MERSSGTDLGLILVAIAVAIAALVAFAFLKNDNQMADAATSAAQPVSHSADQAGDAANKKK